VAWFFKGKEQGDDRPKKVNIAEGLWVKCDSCKEIVYRAEVDRAGRVCPKCRYPFRISAQERIASLLDTGSFEERETGLRSRDPLGFKDTKRYTDRVKAARGKTGLEEAVITGLGRIGGYEVAVGVFEFGFLGGSMASVVGEKLTRLIEFAVQKRVPVLIVSASGGARMQEGVLALMQMAKVNAVVGALHRAGVPYFSVLTDPTFGGTAASLALLADINIAEPGAAIGFTGPRVIKQATYADLPPGFQSADFQMSHGQVDLVTSRTELRPLLAHLLELYS